MTQDNFAFHAATQDLLSDKENGVVRVFADELPAFASLYNVSLDKFFVEKIEHGFS